MNIHYSNWSKNLLLYKQRHLLYKYKNALLVLKQNKINVNTACTQKVHF